MTTSVMLIKKWYYIRCC